MPFKKGDPNINRSGRPPKGQSYAETVRDLLASGEIKVTITKKGEKKGEETEKKLLHISTDTNFYYALASVQLAKAIQGEDTFSARELINRAEGKAKEEVTVITDSFQINPHPDYKAPDGNPDPKAE